MDFQVPVGIARLTATQIAALPTPTSSWLVYNITSGALQFWNGSAWENLAITTPPAGTEDLLTPVNNSLSGHLYRIQIYEQTDETGATNAVIQAIRVA